MNARCTGCDAFLDFRAVRGAKLKDQRCDCGRRYEPIYFEKYDTDGRPIYRNYNNRQFYLDGKKYIPVIPTVSI